MDAYMDDDDGGMEQVISLRKGSGRPDATVTGQSFSQQAAMPGGRSSQTPWGSYQGRQDAASPSAAYDHYTPSRHQFKGYRNIGGPLNAAPFLPAFEQEDDFDDHNPDSDPLPARWVPHADSGQVQDFDVPSRQRPVSDLPHPFRRCYRFVAFNAVQSACFDSMFGTDENVVIGAPTGCGKTVLFELAIFRTFQQNENSRVVYMAPTKSLCHERSTDWQQRFASMGLVCTELTGDTSSTDVFAEVKKSHIIVTTPEKWDSITRKWRDHQKLLSQLRLVCMDEVHILGEQERGATLEVVVSHMKTMCDSVRFVAVSATVPNISDVASWIGPNGQDRLTAKTFAFGEEHRPIPLDRYVYGYPSAGTNDFSFCAGLNGKLMGLIQQHASGKPVLVFCSTRKACGQAAEAIVSDYKKLQGQGRAPWLSSREALSVKFTDQSLQTLATAGVAFHHAGLSSKDRQAVESAFIKGDIQVICTTSTLAVGVNLPARMVVVRGTKQWDQSHAISSPYSDLDLMQMMGRAGRPQFDKKGVAVIMTEQENKDTYERLVRSETVLESCLHKSLVEHLNSEVALGPINSVDTALQWLQSTFLYVRASLNPRYYGVEDDDLPDRRLEELIKESVATLAADGLITDETGAGDSLVCTSKGDIMSRSYVSHRTFVLFCNVKRNSSVRELLELLASAKEFEQLRIRQGEKHPLLEICKRPEIRFPIAKIASVVDKVMILTQVVLGLVPLSELATDRADSHNFSLHAHLIFKDAPRLMRSLIDVLREAQDAGSMCSALELSRSFSSHAWDGTAKVLRQLGGIGEKSVQILEDNQIWSFEQLASTKAAKLESLLGRQPPFGANLVAEAKAVPRISLETINWQETSTNEGVDCSFTVTIGLRNEGPVKAPDKSQLTVFTHTSDNQWIDSRRIKVTKVAQCPKTFALQVKLDKPSQKIIILAAIDTMAGTQTRVELSSRSCKATYPKATRPPPVPDLARLPDKPSKITHLQYESDPEDKPLVHPAAGKGDPMRLPNGRYKCQHTCKNACKHVCCRLDKPPQIRKPKSSTLEKQDAPAKGSKKRQYSSMLETVESGSRLHTIETLKSKAGAPRPAPKKAKRTTALFGLEDDDDDLPDASAPVFKDADMQIGELDDGQDALFFEASPSPPARKRFPPSSPATPEPPSKQARRADSSVLSPSPARGQAIVRLQPSTSSAVPKVEEDDFESYLNEHTTE